MTWPSWIAALLEPLGAHRELVALVALGRLGGGLFEPAAGVGRLGLDPGQLDLDLRRALRGLLGALPQLDLGCTELSQRCPQLARAGGACVDARPERRLEALRCLDGRSQRLAEPLGAGEHAPEQVGVERPGTRARVGCGEGSRPCRLRRLGRREGEPLGRLGQLACLPLDVIALGCVDLQQPDLPFAAETRALQLRRGGTLVGASGLSSRLVLEPADARELACELRRALRPEVRDLGVRGLGGGGTLGGRGRVGFRLPRLGLQRDDLAFELAPARLELEQDRLGRLAGEPELPALRVVAEPLVGDRRDRAREQLVEGDDR